VLFLPMLLGLTAWALVYAATHPPRPSIVADPGSQGVYFESVSMVSGDGTALTGWLIPTIDARRVIDEKERVLRVRSPGVVLVHDFGQTPQQMLPFLASLHEEGIVVLVIGLRGEGTDTRAPQTFGLREVQDVQAGVELLRRGHFMDPERIAVVGIGTGANAALLAAGRDSRITALVLADPLRHPVEAVTHQVSPQQPWMQWMQPICRWAFELTYHVDVDDLKLERSRQVTASRPVMILDTPVHVDGVSAETVEKVRLFCQKRLHTRDDSLAGAARD
jgi:hypothetical protein